MSGDSKEKSLREAMGVVAESLDLVLNGEGIKNGGARKNGFVLLLFPFDDKTGACHYVSNGADHGDIVRMFKEQIRQLEGHKKAEEIDAAVEGVEKINNVLHQFAAGQFSRDECRRILTNECNVADWGIDDLLDTYDPAEVGK